MIVIEFGIVCQTLSKRRCVILNACAAEHGRSQDRSNIITIFYNFAAAYICDFWQVQNLHAGYTIYMRICDFKQLF